MNPIITLLFICTGLLPFVPSVDDPMSIVFAAIYSLCWASVLWRSEGKLRIDLTALFVLGLMIYLPVSMMVGSINGLDIATTVRAAIPFIFAITYILFLQNCEAMAKNFIRYFEISALSWASLIILFHFDSFLSALSGSLLRLTFEVSAMIVPLGMVGMIATLYDRRLSAAFRLPLSLFFLLLVILSGYRSQILICVAVALFRYRDIYRASSLLMVLVLGSAVATFATLNSDLLFVFLNRLSYSAGDDVRALERAFAFQSFLASPLVGQGLGHLVPVDATRPATVVALFEKTHVSYIHNLAFYVLMDFGVIGAILFSAILLTPVLSHARRLISGKFRENEEAAFMLLLSILVYFQISASFRQIQMWLIVSMLLVVLNEYKRQDIRRK